MLTFIYLFTQILLIALKVTDIIDWSWVKILIPTWVILCIAGILLLLWVIMCVLIVSAAL